MSDHPIATAEQHAHELAALELMRHPVVAKAYDDVRARWLDAVDPSPDMRSCFEWASREVMFSAVVWSSNQDPLRPKITCITRLGHPVDGVDVPGSRWGIDNPDSIYRVIPISGEERYVLRGRVAERRMAENYFTLWDPKMNTIDVLSGHDLVLDADRRFEISVDREPAGDRPNHIQSSDAAQEFYIRDVMLDWALDEPNELEIERLGGEPAKPAMTIDEQAELTVSYMERFADFTQKITRGMKSSPPNQLQLAYSADKGGALRRQVYVGGNFSIGDDDAVVIDVNDGGAAYFVVPTGNVWGTTLDIFHRTSTLNKAQAEPNADGTYTFVLSKHDPGVHNWIDPCDLGEGILTLRLAEFPEQRPNEGLSAKSRVVPMASLKQELPDETRWMSADDRAAQQAARAAGYRRRLPEVEA